MRLIDFRVFYADLICTVVVEWLSLWHYGHELVGSIPSRHKIFHLKPVTLGWVSNVSFEKVRLFVT